MRQCRNIVSEFRQAGTISRAHYLEYLVLTAPVPVITIDGPSGVGKGTLSSYLCEALGWHFLDSGALYRIVAWAAIENDIGLEDEKTLAILSRKLDIVFSLTTQPGRDVGVHCAGQNVTSVIRSEQCGRSASIVASLPKVRAALLDRQRAFRNLPGLVADGRDMGKVVFPDAKLKVFLTASQEERAQRRYKQLKAKKINVSLDRLFADIAERDARDRGRGISPLLPAEDAIIIDTTEVDVDTLVNQIVSLARERFKNNV